MRDLGLQATVSIMGAKDPLQKLVDLSQNFPMHANTLSSVKVPNKLRREVQSNTESALLRNGMLGGGVSTLYVNGRPVDIGLNTFNLFSLLRTIRSETATLERLSQLSQSLPSSTARRLRELGMAGGGRDGGDEAASVRVDIVSGAKGCIQFVNNIEKDPQYKKWPKSMRQLLFPTWSLHTIGRNLYTAIIVLDPTTDAGLEAINEVQALVAHMYPVRFGFVLTSRANMATLLQQPAAILGDGTDGVPLPMAFESGPRAPFSVATPPLTGSFPCSADLRWCFGSRPGSTSLETKAKATDISVLFGAAKEKYGAKEAMDFLTGLASDAPRPLSLQVIYHFPFTVPWQRGAKILREIFCVKYFA